MKRWRVAVEDVWIFREVVEVTALTEKGAKEWADELVDEGEPEENYRRFDVELIEEDEPVDEDFG